MNWTKDRVESDQRISEAFKYIAVDPEIHEAIMQAILKTKEYEFFRTTLGESGNEIHRVSGR